MQTLWSRAVQTKCTCRCPSCLPTPTTASRRATTTAAKRRLRYGDAFTFFYSSILATAAVTDARRKDEKTEQWDKAIVQAKEELRAIETEQERRLQALSTPIKLDRLENWKDTGTWENIFDWAAHQNQSRLALGYGKLEGIQARVLNGLSPATLRELCMNGKIMEAREGRREPDVKEDVVSDRPLSTKKRKTMELSTAKMVFRLLLQSSRSTTTESVTLNPSERLMWQALMRNVKQLRSKLTEMEGRLSQLRRLDANSETLQDLESPQFPRYSDCAPRATDGSPSLNTTLETLLAPNRREITDINAMVTKICYNLLVSTTPPNVHTYNILITRLCHFNQLEMASIVLDSMRECHIRPNEVTVAATLRYYTLANDRRGFRSYVNRMQGKGGGLTLAHPSTSITHINQVKYVAQRAGNSRYMRLPQFSTLRNERSLSAAQPIKLINKAPRNQEVFSALIIGSLKLLGFNQAMSHYLDMVRCGWETDVHILVALLKYCSDAENWLFGQKVWQEIKTLASSATKTAYFLMLRLCLICGREEEFRSILRDGIERTVLDVSLTQLSFSISPNRLKTVMGKGSKQRAEHIERFVYKLERKTEQIGFGSYKLAKEVHEIEKSMQYGSSVALMIAHRLKLSNRGGPAYRLAEERRKVEALLNSKAAELDLSLRTELVHDSTLTSPLPEDSDASTHKSTASFAIIPQASPQSIRTWDRRGHIQHSPTVSNEFPYLAEESCYVGWEQSLAAA